MRTVVAKFGGSSLADAERISEVLKIVRENPDLRYVVVSAPGKRYEEDYKITNLLVAANQAGNRENDMHLVGERFLTICEDLGISQALRDDIIGEILRLTPHPDPHEESAALHTETLALGERLCAPIVAEKLGWPVVDPKDLITLRSDGSYDPGAPRKTELPPYAVIPGYYAAGPEGETVLFPRNGSDISGAIVSAIARADVYENWTDTNGILMTDPKVVRAPSSIPELTRDELQELAYRGTTVLHGDSLYPLMGTDIPVHVRNTLNPSHPGTLVVRDASLLTAPRHPVVAIAGRRGFAVVTLHKIGMNQKRGFLADLCHVFDEVGISIELAPGGINSQSLVVADEELKGKEELLEKAVTFSCEPDRLLLERNSLALLCIVGETMSHQHGVAARALTAIAKAGVNVRVIDQGASEISIIIGVDNADYETAVRALYAEFSA